MNPTRISFCAALYEYLRLSQSNDAHKFRQLRLAAQGNQEQMDAEAQDLLPLHLRFREMWMEIRSALAHEDVIESFSVDLTIHQLKRVVAIILGEDLNTDDLADPFHTLLMCYQPTT